MKKTLIAFLAVVTCASYANEITPNTEFFNLQDFYYKNPGSADYVRYQVSGFYERNSGGTLSQRVYILPQLKFNRNQIRFISKNGKSYNLDDNVDANDISKAKISLSYNGTLPTKEQSMGVLSQIDRTPLDVIIPKYSIYEFGGNNPNNMLESISPVAKDGLKNFNIESNQKRQRQEQLFSRWSSMSPQVVAINSLRVKVLIDGDIVGERKLPNTVVSSGFLPDIYLNDLTPYQINRLKQLEFEIEVDYLFKDLKKSSINAQFDLEQMMNTVINESRKIDTKSSSSGVQFLGFGSRRKTMSQSLKESFSEQTTSDKKANTTVEMTDADEDMIDMFESQFFPKLTQEKLVQEHLAAAQKAQQEGNTMLANAHFGYAQAIQEQKDDLSVDIKGALDSLSKKDYVGFIAKGIKMQDSKSKGSSQYARVLSSSVKEGQHLSWNFNKSVSVNRSVTQLITVNEDISYKPFLGICAAQIVLWVIPVYKGYGHPANPSSYEHGPYNYILPTCIVDNTALQLSEIGIGTPIRKIAGQQLNSYGDLSNILNSYHPGDEIEITYLGYTPLGPNNGYYSEKNTKIKLSKGPAR